MAQNRPHHHWKNNEKSLNQWIFPECILYFRDFNAHLIRPMICQDDIGRTEIQSKDCHKNVTTKCKKAGVANRTKIFQSLRVNFVTITQHCRNFRTRFKYFQKLDFYSKEFKKNKWTGLNFSETIVHFEALHSNPGNALHFTKFDSVCTDTPKWWGIAARMSAALKSAALKSTALKSIARKGLARMGAARVPYADFVHTESAPDRNTSKENYRLRLLSRLAKRVHKLKIHHFHLNS